MEHWLSLSATALGEQIGDGKIDPIDLCETFLTAISTHPQSGRIYARTTPERARAEAAAASNRARSGQRLSILDGVPISWKDLVDTANVVTEAGSGLLKGRTPQNDAIVLERATRAGLVCLGKTHMSELAFSGLGLNPVTKTSPCVNDQDAVAGGSSSGAATSVAFGLAAAGIGSDTGGSVRIPAAWNDLVGLKTTAGLLALNGIVPLCETFDTIGPLCRTVEDCAHISAAMGATKAPDLRGATLKGRRFLILENVAMDHLEGAPAAAFGSAIERLEASGAIVERGEIEGVERALDLSAMLYTSEAYATWKHEIEAAPDKMFAEILARFRSGRSHSGPDYVAAIQELERIRVTWKRATARYDAVLTPSSPIMPPKIDRLMSDQAYYVEKNLLALRNTRIGNLMGLCAVTLPTGVPSTGLQIMCDGFSEAKLLRLARAAEIALA